MINPASTQTTRSRYLNSIQNRRVVGSCRLMKFYYILSKRECPQGHNSTIVDIVNCIES